MVQKKEKVSINGVKIENLLDKAFMEKIIKELSEEVSPISIVFVKKPNIIITIGHENEKEIESGIVHLQCSDEKRLEVVATMLDKR